MAGTSFLIDGQPCFIDYSDGEGRAVVNGKEWRWDFHEYCGPTFYNKDGEPRKNFPSENHPVWKSFNKWLRKYEKEKDKKQKISERLDDKKLPIWIEKQKKKKIELDIVNDDIES